MTDFKLLYRPRVVFTVLCIINLFNYIDRGIIPGSTVEFNDFIQNDISTNTPDVYLGLLQSSFIVGFVIGSVLFANIVHRYPHFFIMGIGLSIWIGANVLAGISYSTGSYAFLLISRSISGFGEASMQCIAPPWIEVSAPKGYSGTWLSIYFTAIPVGTAVGYTYSSAVSTTIGWQYAFYIEAILVAPLVALLFYFSHFYPMHVERGLIRESSRSPVIDRSSNSHITAGEVEMSNVAQNSPPNPANVTSDESGGSTKSGTYTPLEKPEKHPTMWQETKIILSEPLYLCLTLGNAAQTGSLIGVATFGSAYLLGLGYYSTESQSSTVFGIVISLAGIVGTPLGGYLLDRHKGEGNIRPVDESERTTLAEEEQLHQQQQNINVTPTESTGLNIETRLSIEVNNHGTSETESEELKRCPQHNLPTALRMDHTFNIIFWYTVIGVALLCCAYFVYDKVGFITIICLGCTAIFLTNPGIYWGCMLVSHPRHRAFAVALNSVIEHVFGDVPSPIIAGYIKDSLAPNCVAAQDATDDEVANVAISPSCRDDNHGLRVAMTVVFAYMIMTAFFFALGWYINFCRLQKHRQVEAAKSHSRQAHEQRNSNDVVV